jgi:hypothetical protein
MDRRRLSEAKLVAVEILEKAQKFSVGVGVGNLEPFLRSRLQQRSPWN